MLFRGSQGHYAAFLWTCARTSLRLSRFASYFVPDIEVIPVVLWTDCNGVTGIRLDSGFLFLRPLGAYVVSRMRFESHQSRFESGFETGMVDVGA